MLTKEMTKKVETTFKEKGQCYYAGFATCLIMDELISGTFGATKALIISGAIDKENEDKLLYGFEGENLDLLEIFKGNTEAMAAYMAVDTTDRLLEGLKCKFAAATGYTMLLGALGILEKSDVEYIHKFLVEIITDEHE